MIWFDCEGVVRRVRRLLQGGTPRLNSPNYDLWILLAHEFADSSPDQFAITHVASHRGDNAASPLEEWCFKHNHWADRTAVRINFARSEKFWELFQRHVGYVQAAQDISRIVQGAILNISRLAVQSPHTDSDHEGAVVDAPSALHFWKGLPEQISMPSDAFRWYPERIVRLILSWFLQNVHGSPHAVVWMSQAQLYLAFQMATGSYGPIKQGTWQDGDANCLIDLVGHSFRKRARWFSKVLRETLRKCGILVHHHFGLPCSTALKFHTGTLAVPWSPDQMNAIDRWILGHLPHGVRRVSGALDRLPCARRNTCFDEVFISCL